MVESLIEIQSKKEQSEFIKYLEARNKNGFDFGVQLYAAYIKGIHLQKKKEWGNNRFAVIKKRLTDNLSAFIAEQIVENEAFDEVYLIKQLLLARKLMRHKKHQVAYSILSKAQLKAKVAQLYAIENQILLSIIECSVELTEINLENVIIDYDASNSSQSNYQQRFITNSKARKAFKAAEFEGVEIDIEKEFNSFKQSIEQSKTSVFDYKDLLDIVRIADAHALLTKNYAEANVFYIEQLKALRATTPLKNEQIPYLIELLYLISNIYFRKKEFDTSLNLLQEMKEAMEFSNAFYAKQFEVKFTSLLALNFNFLGNHKRAELLLDRLLISENAPVNEHLNPILIRCMIAFQQQQYKHAIKLLAKLQENDKFYLEKMGIDWLLNKKYMEILLHIELHNYDFVEARIQSLIQKHGSYLKERKAFQVLPFLKLVKYTLRNPHEIQTEKFHNKVEGQLNWKPSNQEDLFLMCFYAWLKSKMIKQPLYETTLQVISN